LDEFPENSEGDLEVEDKKVSRNLSKYEFEDNHDFSNSVNEGNLRGFRYKQALKRRNN
jgi:hypothetical protein